MTASARVPVWDRITHPAQIISSLPQAIATMLDPADCGPAFIGLPQDVQEICLRLPSRVFEETLWTIPRPRPDRDQVAAAAALLKTAKKPLIISGGGVRYSGAGEALADFASARGIPMAETIAGKGAVCTIILLMSGPLALKARTRPRNWPKARMS